MNEKQLNESVGDILQTFGLANCGDFTIELFDLIKNLESLVLIYANRVGEEPQEENLDTEDGQQKAFLRTAWGLARIARLYGKKFQKLQRKYPDFDLQLEKAAKRAQAQLIKQPKEKK